VNIICTFFDKVLNGWEIEADEVMTVLTDNGSNILKAFGR
jgi:hypothetical protein